jgi:hypothetical protein
MLIDQKTPEVAEGAVRWFEDNFPEQITFFSFSSNELEVLGKFDPLKIFHKPPDSET